jgi:hypothetical protein
MISILVVLGSQREDAEAVRERAQVFLQGVTLSGMPTLCSRFDPGLLPGDASRPYATAIFEIPSASPENRVMVPFNQVIL